MVQRHLPGLERQRHSGGLVHVLHLLPPGQQIIVAEGIDVIAQRRVVRARDHVHAAVFFGDVADRDPTGDPVVGLHPGVAGVLVPADEALALRFLDEQGRTSRKDVPTEHVFDGVEHPAVVYDPVENRQRQMPVVAPCAIEGVGPVGLGGFDFSTDFGDLLGGKDIDGRDVTIALVGGLLFGGQAFGHGRVPQRSVKVGAEFTQRYSRHHP